MGTLANNTHVRKNRAGSDLSNILLHKRPARTLLLYFLGVVAHLEAPSIELYGQKNYDSQLLPFIPPH